MTIRQVDLRLKIEKFTTLRYVYSGINYHKKILKASLLYLIIYVLTEIKKYVAWI